MNANLASHMSDELKSSVLPMWSAVDVEKAEEGDLILVARIPCPTTDDGLELVPAFRLVLENGGANVFFVGGPWRSAMDERFNAQRVQMDELKAKLEKFWFRASSMMIFALHG